MFREPGLGDTLVEMARGGGSSVDEGAVGARILKGIAERGSKERAFQGWAAADLKTYTVIRRHPVCHPIQRWQLCTVPPPSGGGLAILQTLALLEATGPMSNPKRPQTWPRFATAPQWADADRF